MLRFCKVKWSLKKMLIVSVVWRMVCMSIIDIYFVWHKVVGILCHQSKSQRTLVLAIWQTNGRQNWISHCRKVMSQHFDESYGDSTLNAAWPIHAGWWSRMNLRLLYTALKFSVLADRAWVSDLCPMCCELQGLSTTPATVQAVSVLQHLCSHVW
jgi:hypothetical protein